jgi:hypothetical protein
MQSLEIIENKLDKESGSTKLGSLIRTKVIADITNTPRGIPIRDYTRTQVYPLLGIIRGLGRMSQEGKWKKSNLLHLLGSTRRMNMHRHGC